jgi:putative oxidoreductase
MVIADFSLVAYSDWILLIVRLILGITFIYYGWGKVKDFRQNGKDFEGMGFKPGMFWGTIVALVEFVGGIAIVLGIYVGYFGALMAINMIIGTIWKKTKTDKPFTDWSYDLLLLGLALVMVGFGAGRFSLI